MTVRLPTPKTLIDRLFTRRRTPNLFGESARPLIRSVRFVDDPRDVSLDVAVLWSPPFQRRDPVALGDVAHRQSRVKADQFLNLPHCEEVVDVQITFRKEFQFGVILCLRVV